MSDDQFLAIYVYEPIRLRARPTQHVVLNQLAFINGQFDTTPLQVLTDQTLELSPGVYGWYAPVPVPFEIDGYAVVLSVRKPGKDPWPPPPPPPPSSFANDPSAVRLWAVHLSARDGQAFLSGLG